jgi:NAD(P)-dependent dehydrogenase (short-subunit alcohol dehydrogenase family)
MSVATSTFPIRPEPALVGQIVVVIGGSAGIGLETARRARAEGAKLILAARNAEHLENASRELGGTLSSTAFDATDFDQLQKFFDGLPTPIDHVLVTGPGPYYAPLTELEIDKARQEVEAHLLLPLQVARYASKKVRPGGTLLFMGGTGGRHPAPGLALVTALKAALPAMTKNLALELAPVRVNLIAAGFVDTPLSASLLGDQLNARREQLRATLPIRRVVGPADVAALAVHLMINTALTGATYDIDGGQQLLQGEPVLGAAFYLQSPCILKFPRAMKLAVCHDAGSCTARANSPA